MPNQNSALHLPNEILELIINELAQEDDEDVNDEENLAALASCRLASGALFSLATPLLFSSIWLSDWDFLPSRVQNYVPQAVRLIEFFAVHGNIAHSVRMLSLFFSEHETLENSMSVTLISTILHRLPHIRNFCLYMEQLSTIPDNLASAMHALCRSTNLTKLSLEGVKDFPFMAIISCSNLRCLRLRRFSCELPNSGDETSDPQFLHLDSLEIDSESLHTSPHLTKYFTQIKNFQLKAIPGWTFVGSTEAMLMRVSQTLTTFEFITESSEEVSEDDIPYDLGWFPVLRCFKIVLWAQNDPSYLAELFSISSSSIGIETLEVTITLIKVQEADVKNIFSSESGWSTLDQLFVSQTFRSLKKVLLHLYLGKGNRSSEEVGREPNLRSEILPYLDDLFPLWQALNGRVLEVDLAVF